MRFSLLEVRDRCQPLSLKGEVKNPSDSKLFEFEMFITYEPMKLKDIKENVFSY